jgi:hypothetical protein
MEVLKMKISIKEQINVKMPYYPKKKCFRITLENKELCDYCYGIEEVWAVNIKQALIKYIKKSEDID